jgi:hypothetical protein
MKSGTDIPIRLSAAERAEIRAEHRSWLFHIAFGALQGMAIGALVAIAIVVLDVQGIGTLLKHSANPVGNTLMLVAGFSHTFGMAAAGTAIWFRAMEPRR